MLFLFCVLLIAVISDLKAFKVPNWLVVVGLIGGLYYRFSQEELTGIYKALIASSIPMIGLYPLFKVGVFGAGDIKLLAVVGSFLGTGEIISCMICSFVVGAIISILKMFKKRIMKQRFIYFFSYLQETLQSGYILPYHNTQETKEETVASNIHFSIPILISLLLHWGGVY